MNQPTKTVRSHRGDYVCLGILGLCLVFRWATPIVIALGWHAVHRPTIAFDNYRVHVPVLWWAMQDEGSLTHPQSVTLARGSVLDLHGKGPFAFGSFSSSRLNETTQDIEKTRVQVDRRFAEHTESYRRLAIVGMIFQCFQRVGASTVRLGVRDIACYPEVERGREPILNVTFWGSPEFVDEFFQVASTLQSR